MTSKTSACVHPSVGVVSPFSNPKALRPLGQLDKAWHLYSESGDTTSRKQNLEFRSLGYARPPKLSLVVPAS